MAGFVREVLDDLVRLETPSDRADHREPMAKVRALLEDLGGDVETIGPDERPVHVATYGEPRVLLLGHVDVVPPGQGWTTGPYKPVEQDGRLFGRGTSDMKAGVAAMLAPVAELGGDADVAVALTSDEETTMDGAAALADHPVVDRVDAVVLPEFTDLEVGLGENGLYQFELTVGGEAAHASTPEQGRSAIRGMVRLIDALEGFDVAGATLNVGVVEGGLKVNVVPPTCRAEVDVRFPPERSQEQVVARLRELLDQAGVRYEWEVIHALPPVAADADDPEVRRFLAAADADGGSTMTYATDAAQLAPLPVPAIIYGPGEMHTPHKPDEWVDLAKVDRAAETFRRYVAADR